MVKQNVPGDLYLDALTSKSVLATDSNGKVIAGSVDLSGYVPYTGASSDVNLGSKNFTTTGTGTFGTEIVGSLTVADNGQTPNNSGVYYYAGTYNTYPYTYKPAPYYTNGTYYLWFDTATHGAYIFSDGLGSYNNVFYWNQLSIYGTYNPVPPSTGYPSISPTVSLNSIGSVLIGGAVDDGSSILIVSGKQTFPYGGIDMLANTAITMEGFANIEFLSGSAAKFYDGSSITDGSLVSSIYPHNRQLIDSSGNLAAQWDSTGMKDASGNNYLTSSSWVGTATSALSMMGNFLYMYDGLGSMGGNIYMDGGNIYMDGGTIYMPLYSVIKDGTYTSIDPYNRRVYANDGSTIQADYSTAYALSLAGAGTPVSGSIFAGAYAGDSATFASDSNFFGNNAGYGATNASYSNFFGEYAGQGATSAYSSNFFGPSAGSDATNVHESNFFGPYAGFQATNAYQSNFFGNYAGFQATNAYQSNFFGNYAGYRATNAYYTNFFGNIAGYEATNASSSNFFGSGAGQGATNADHSNFFGNNAGSGQTIASYSIFLGTNVGNNNAETGKTDFQNNLIIDQSILSTNSPRASAADIRQNALLYGTFADTASGQQLTINASVTINDSLNAVSWEDDAVFCDGEMVFT